MKPNPLSIGPQTPPGTSGATFHHRSVLDGAGDQTSAVELCQLAKLGRLTLVACMQQNLVECGYTAT